MKNYITCLFLLIACSDLIIFANEDTLTNEWLEIVELIDNDLANIENTEDRKLFNTEIILPKIQQYQENIFQAYNRDELEFMTFISMIHGSYLITSEAFLTSGDYRSSLNIIDRGIEISKGTFLEIEALLTKARVLTESNRPNEALQVYSTIVNHHEFLKSPDLSVQDQHLNVYASIHNRLKSTSAKESVILENLITYMNQCVSMDNFNRNDQDLPKLIEKLAKQEARLDSKLTKQLQKFDSGVKNGHQKERHFELELEKIERYFVKQESRLMKNYRKVFGF